MKLKLYPNGDHYQAFNDIHMGYPFTHKVQILRAFSGGIGKGWRAVDHGSFENIH
jgi:hypothetical protein